MGSAGAAAWWSLLVGAGNASANPFRVDRRMDEREHDVL